MSNNKSLSVQEFFKTVDYETKTSSIAENIKLDFTAIGFAYIGGITEIKKEQLESLWKKGLMKSICPKCNSERFLVYSGGGSPLTGSGSFWGYCFDCEETHKDRKGFSKIGMPALEALGVL